MADALVITRWFRVINDAEVMAKRNALLKEKAEKYAAKARALSAVPKGLGKGVKSGDLQRAITVSTPFASGSGKSVGITIRADPGVAKHAIWQEEGTGLYGKKQDWIYPTNKRFMHWEQTGRAYRGASITASLKSFKYGPGSRGRRKRVEKIYDQYASRVRGVKPKHYMRDARNDKVIRAEHRAAMVALVRRTIQASVGAP
jgi:hypothetical protein